MVRPVPPQPYPSLHRRTPATQTASTFTPAGVMPCTPIHVPSSTEASGFYPSPTSLCWPSHDVSEVFLAPASQDVSIL